MNNYKYIASLDVGTTTIRCFIYDANIQIRGTASEQVQLLYPQPGFVEIEPETLWTNIIKTIKNAIKNANLTASDISCLGITTQRSTFITWHTETGKPFHNFITWKDLRADSLVKKWNSSCYIKAIRGAAYALYLITRNKRFLAASVFTLMNSQATLRLTWIIENNKELKEAIINKTAAFGLLDTWLLYRLKTGNVCGKYVEHVSDITGCASTGFYDPFTLKWSDYALKVFSLKAEMLPKVVDNSYNYGYIDKTVVGHEIRIGCIIGDQSASMWGSCSFQEGDLKVTLGTGSFINVNTGAQCNASVHGLYPLVAWRWFNQQQNNEELVYCVEGASSDTGSIIKWAMDFGLFTNPIQSSDIANSVENTDGVYFIPAFSGLGPPINDYQAACGLIGIRPSTKKAHIVRAVLESIAFRVAQLYACTLEETKYKFSVIRIDGGVSKNDFLCQLLADLTGLQIERSESTELTVLGTCFLAGLNTGIWKSREELINLRKIDKIFMPRPDRLAECLQKLEIWERAVDRCKGWYNPSDLEKNNKLKSD